jgi:YhcH/YjgK/YiaL family protein
MIFGHVNDLESGFAWLPNPLKTALGHLKKTDFAALPVGNYELQGRDIYVQVIDLSTKPFAETRPEVHREYIDVQFLFRGAENIGFAADTGNNKLSEDLLQARDLLFYTAMENESTLTMTPGSFAVFFPSDVHRPACAAGEPVAIRKIVVKVRMSLLAGSAV